MAALLIRLFIAFAVVTTAANGRKKLADLFFPKGTSFTVNVAYSVFMPKGFAHVTELDFIYPVVDKVMAKKPPPKTMWINPIDYNRIKKWEAVWHRRNRLIKDRQRRDIRLQLENAIHSFGFDGPRCVLRFQCELNAIAEPKTLTEDVLLILFKRRNLNCIGYEQLCPFSLLYFIMNSQSVNDTSYY